MPEVASQTLDFVARELNVTLAEARNALENYVEQPDNVNLLERCAQELHQVQGVLRVLEIYGAALLAEEMEQVASYLLATVAERKSQAESLDALMRAMVQLPSYLERVLAGGRDLALVLLPLLNDLRAVRGSALLSEGTLLLLNLKSDKQAQPAAAVPGEPPLTVEQWGRRLRARFQVGLIGWIRGERIEQNLDILAAVAQKLEQIATRQPVFQLWWVTGAVIEALQENGLESGVSIKRLLGLGDREIRRLYEQSEARYAQSPPVELLNNLLYYVGRAESAGPRVSAVRASFRLAELLPVDETIEQERENLSAPSVKLMQTVAAAIREDLSKVKDVLDIFVRRGAGQPKELSSQVEMLRKIGDTLGVLGLGELRGNVQEQTERLDKLVQGVIKADEASLVEIAAALIAVEDRLDSQLVGLIRPKSATEPEEGEDSEFQQVQSAVLRECILNLARIKEAITQNVGGTLDAAGLDSWQELMRGLKAGLLMLGKARAVEIIEGITGQLKRVMQPGGQGLPPGFLDRLADSIVSVEYYMETLQAGRSDPWYMLDNAQACVHALESQEAPAVPTVAPLELSAFARTVQIPPPTFGPEAVPAASVPGSAAPTLTQTRAPASNVLETADPELLKLFIEEAHEELVRVKRFFPAWDQNPLERDSLITVRRSFHTLKGSGRMVGARDLGEFAWSIENLLNRILDNTLSRSPTIVEVLREAIAALPELIEQLETGRAPRVDASSIATRAHALAAGRPPSSRAVSFPESMPPESAEVRAPVQPQKAPHAPAVAAQPDTPSEEGVGHIEAVPTPDVASAHGRQIQGTSGPASAEMESASGAPETKAPREGWIAWDGEAAPGSDALRLEISSSPEESGHASEGDGGDGGLGLPDEKPAVGPDESVVLTEAPEAGAPMWTSTEQDNLRSGTKAQRAAADDPLASLEEPASVLPESFTSATDRFAQLDEAAANVELPAAQQTQDDVLRDIYARETGAHVATVRAYLQREAGLPAPHAIPEEVYRACHTLSGSSKMAQARHGIRLAEPLDHWLRRVFSSGLGLQSEDMALLADCMSAMEMVVSHLDEATGYFQTHWGLQERIAQAERALDQRIAAAAQAQTEAPPAPTLAAEEEPAEAMGDFDPEVAAIFTEEATELIELSEGALSDWRADPASADYRSALKRPLHTLKGGARMAGITAMGDLSHELETLVMQVDNGSVAADEPVFDVIQASLDELARMREAVANGGRVAPARAMIARIQALSRPGAAASAQAVEAPATQSTHVASTTQAPVPATPEAAAATEAAATEAPEVHAPETWGSEISVPSAEPAWTSEITAPPAASVPPWSSEIEIAGSAPATDAGDVAESPEAQPTEAAGSPQGLSPGELPDTVVAPVTIDEFAEAELTSGNVAAEILAETAPAHEELGETPEWDPSSPAQASESASSTISVSVPLGRISDEALMPPQAVPPGREPVGPPERQEMARVDAELLDQLLNISGEASIARSRLEQQLGSIDFNLGELSRTVTRLKEQLRSLEIETEAQILHRHEDESGHRGDFDPLELDRYSSIQQFSRALAETANDVASIQQLLENLAKDTQNLLQQQARTITELQNGLMRTRMVPFQRHVQRLARIVRQAATDTGKRVELTVEGASGELDRQVLERMLPPFEHMLRNAVVHGIEKPGERLAANKPETGKIVLELHREGAEVMVRLSDDGGGMNLQAIREKGAALGLIPPGRTLSDEDAMQLILEPGFSTAGTITQQAGRGVGMDVVATEIKRLGGALHMETKPGEGTTFTIRLPFTLAISHALVVRTGEEFYALPLPTVEGVLRLSKTEVSAHLGRDAAAFDYNEQKYRFQYLATFVGLEPSPLPEQDVTIPVVLVRAGEHSTGLIADELVGSREIVVKSVGPQISSIRGISGATILGDGRIVIILDIGALVRAEWRGRAPALPLPQKDRADKRTFAMVVDDSITVRRVTQRLLERNGMRVVTARDGMDAVTLLQDNVPDIILLDIEMPRMDGYEVAAHVRNDPRLKDVPIIMITSRVGEKHRARAIELGVDDYLGKPYQEAQLLDAIEPLVERRRAAQGSGTFARVGEARV
jgi:chemosensory pili system protein ChpA (sensor histidine kinase/response regulator)